MCWGLKFPKTRCVPNWTAITCICESIILTILRFTLLLQLLWNLFSIQEFFSTKEWEVMSHKITFSVDRFRFHNAYTDPLGWTEQSLFTVKNFTATEITQLLQETQHTEAPLLFIDSLSWVVRHHDTVAVCQELQKLKKGLSSLQNTNTCILIPLL